jgi:hypothetical protein
MPKLAERLNIRESYLLNVSLFASLGYGVAVGLVVSSTFYLLQTVKADPWAAWATSWVCFIFLLIIVSISIRRLGKKL